MSTGLSLRKSNGQEEVPQLADALQPHVECCICLGTLHNAASCTPCLHTFCMGCISRWADTNNGRCPMCRVSVKEISPNWMIRDLVKKYCIVRPDQQRLQKDMERLDKAELEYMLKWLGSTDNRLLNIESLASLQGPPEKCDQKYNSMLSRATDLLKAAVERAREPGNNTPITNESLTAAMGKLLKDIRKEVMPETVFKKYHRIELAYKKLVKVSVPMIGPSEHTWLGNYLFDHNIVDPDLSDLYNTNGDNDAVWNLDVSSRISDAMSELLNPTLPSRRQPRPLIHGFDPIELEALARVQNMRVPGFRRQAPEVNVAPIAPIPPRVARHRDTPEPRRPYIGSVMQTRRQQRETENAQMQPITILATRRSARLASRTQ